MLYSPQPPTPLKRNALLIVHRATRESEYDQGTNQLPQDLASKPTDISFQIAHAS